MENFIENVTGVDLNSKKGKGNNQARQCDQSTHRLKQRKKE